MHSRQGSMILMAVLVLTVCGLSSSLAAAAQAEVPLSVEDALQTRSLGETSPIAWSPDGRWIAYMVRNNRRIQPKKSEGRELWTRTGVFSNDIAGDIWISNTDTGAARNLTKEQGSNWGPTWSPDGQLLAFVSDRDGSGQARLWIWDSLRESLRKVSDRNVRANYRMNRIEWTPDSKRVLITTVPDGLSLEEYTEGILRPRESQRLFTETTAGASVAVYRAGPSASSSKNSPDAAMNSLDGLYLHDLVLVNVAAGSVEAAVRGHRIEGYRLSPDGLSVAYIEPKRYQKPGSWQRVYDLSVVNLETRREGAILSDALLDGGFSWSSDGLLLGYRACDGPESSCDYYAVSSRGGIPSKTSALKENHFDGWSQTPLWDAKAEQFYFLFRGALWRNSISEGHAFELARLPNRTILHQLEQSPGILWTTDDGKSTVVLTHDEAGKQDGFYRIDLRTGKGTALLERGQCYTCKWPVPLSGTYLTSVSANAERLAYVAEDAQHPRDLWTTDPNFQKPRQLTHLNPQFEGYKMGSVRLSEWFDDEGEQRRGALLLPPDYRPGQKYPLLVWVYPWWPQSDRLEEFGFGQYPGPFNMQLYATRGYAVLLPDGRPGPGGPAADVAKSVLPAVNKMIELGIADPGRIGVMGHSAGGYATLALLVQTKRFKVAIAADGLGDYGAAYGTLQKDGSGFQSGLTERLLGALPWQNPVRYIENSPFYYLDKIETPLLILHGENDDAVSSFLAGQIFVGLRRLNKEVEYAEYRGEGHVPGDWAYPNQVDVATRVLAWLDKYLKAGEH